MKLPPETLQNTILAMFETRNLRHGDMVWLSRFESFWAETSLRRADLLEGLADLCTHGWIDLEDQDEKTWLALTHKGEVRARMIVSRGLNDVERYVREEVLGPLRFHTLSPNENGTGRRWHEAAQGSFI